MTAARSNSRNLGSAPCPSLSLIDPSMREVQVEHNRNGNKGEEGEHTHAAHEQNVGIRSYQWQHGVHPSPDRMIVVVLQNDPLKSSWLEEAHKPRETEKRTQEDRLNICHSFHHHSFPVLLRLNPCVNETPNCGLNTPTSLPRPSEEEVTPPPRSVVNGLISAPADPDTLTESPLRELLSCVAGPDEGPALDVQYPATRLRERVVRLLPAFSPSPP